MKAAYKWLLNYIKKYRVYFVAAMILSLITNGLSMVPVYISGRIIDELVTLTPRVNFIYNALFIMLGLTMVRAVTRYLRGLLLELAGQGVVYNIRKDLYVHTQNQTFGFFDSNSTGDVMSRFTGDLEAIRDFVSDVIDSTFGSIVVFITAIVMMFSVSWVLTLCLLSIMPIIIIIIRKQSREIRPLFRSVRRQFSKLNQNVRENIGGNRVVKAFTRENYEVEKFTVENDEFRDLNLKTAMAWAKFMPKLDFLTGLCTIILILAGSILVIYNQITVGELFMVNGYLWALVGPMRMFGWVVNRAQRTIASLEKIYAFAKTKCAIQTPVNPASIEKIGGTVEFRDVSFSYSPTIGGPPVLKNINFKLEKGQRIGIVGATGSGKTTIINLLQRFYDVTSGQILVDGIDVREIPLSVLRGGISPAMQDVFLFSDTIEGNIAYGAQELDFDGVVKFAKIADANEFAANLSEGYDTIIGERGVGLSGGQKQRIALARAIATEPAILVLDDTTSAVDMETEMQIQAQLDEHFKNTTTFIIAHRISSVKDADLIIVLEDGEIIEKGTHVELSAKGGHYAELLRVQYSAM